MANFSLRNTILDLLIRIEKDSGFSHLVIDNEIKSQRIPEKDEALMTEIVYGTIQRKLTLDYYLESFVKSKKKIDHWVWMLLRMSVYQMVFLDKVPDHAIIHEAVEIAKRRGHKGVASFVNGVLRNIQRKGVPDTSEIKDKTIRLSIETSSPKWLVKRWISLYGYETTKAMCEANLLRKHLSIRVQPLKISREQAMNRLREEGYEVRPSLFSDQGIVIEKGNILKSAIVKDGLVTIQDQSSMLVAEMLRPAPGSQVLDACSAPGGKATHIAEKMNNEGKINAHDLHKNKTKLIEKKAAELELSIIDAKEADARKLQGMYEKKSFDRILVDAPCTGFGVIRGKPEIKYQKDEEDIKRLAEIQLEILKHVAPLLKDDGILTYSTCTVDVHENEQVVKKFLENNKDFQMDEEFFTELPSEIKDSEGVTEIGVQLFPQTFQTDGFFLTRLKKLSE